MMTDREKIAHILRRFGFGAGSAEMARCEPLGVLGVIEQLFDWEKTFEPFSVPAWQFAFRRDSKDTNLDPSVFTSWWTLWMTMTQRPLQHKLALFYSNLLVAGADKVTYGPMMLDYLETLVEHCGDDFATILAEVSKSPAMIRYLDGDHNLRGKPNENFAREVMELFTIGIGNYTEQDVKQGAKAYSGWWFRSLIYEDDGHKYNERVPEFIRLGLPMVAFCWIPDVHDSGPKTVLGETANFTGEELLAKLAARPETAHRIGTRLWEYFAYARPPKNVQDKMAASFTKHKGNARLVLKDMAHMPEFYSPECARNLVKTPVDFVLPIIRQLDLGHEMNENQGSRDPTVYANEKIRHVGDALTYWMDVMGLRPLHPPNVKGFDWGEAFIDTNAMIKRVEFAGILNDSFVGTRLGEKLRTMVLAADPIDEPGVVNAVLAIFDADHFPDDKRAILAAILKKHGGRKALDKPGPGIYALIQTCKLLFGSPEFQLC